MFCENCGEKLSKDDAFCTNCGSPVKKEESDTTQEVKQEEVEQVTTLENSNSEEMQIKEEKTETVTPVEPTVSTNIQKDNIKKGSTGKVALIIIAILLVLAAIGGALYFFVFKDKGTKYENSVEALTSAFENMQNKKGYTTVINGSIVTDGEDSIDASFNWETNFDIKNKKMKMNFDVTMSGVQIELPAYVDFSDKDNGYVYYKLPSMVTGSDEWNKVSLGNVDFDELMESFKASDDEENSLNDLKEKLGDIDFVKKEKSDIADCDYYKIIINEENLKKLKEAYEELDLTDSDIEEMQLKDGFVIDVYVNKKGNYVSKINLDMANYLNKLSVGEVEFKKFVVSIEYKDIDKDLNITIPDDAKKAEEVDLNDLFGDTIPSIDDNDNNLNIDDDENYVDDYSVTEYGYKVKYNMPKGFKASSVNDDDFKIYHSDDIDVTISNYWDSKEERFEDIEFDKEYYEKSDYYKNVTLTDEKTIKVNDKEFAYRELSYESSYSKYYEATVCYQLDDDHVYRVEYEKSSSPITEDELKLFLDITVSKN